MRIRYNYIIFLLACSTFLSCRDEVDWEPYIQEALEYKMNRLEKKKWQECRERAYSIATRQVDSVILANSGRYFKGLEYPTRRPNRPRTPGLVELMDSMPLKPLFKRDSVGKPEG